MADEKKKKLEKTIEADSKSPAKKKVRGRNRFTKWFREMRSELNKVVWPTPKQIMNNTFVALSVMTTAAIVIWGIDFVGSQIFQAIRLFGSR